MKKMIVLIVVLALASFAAAQQPWTGRTTGGLDVTDTPKGLTIDKLGAHQNGGRGCVGCHAPHSGARGNGGVLAWDGTAYTSVAVTGDSGAVALWGQDLGPIYGASFTFAGATAPLTITATSEERDITGVAMCLSCHDGNVAKGAMMTNKSFEQAAGMLPTSYGTQPIPTLLGADGGTFGNYTNDHPVGEEANIGALSGIKASTNLLQLGVSGTTPILAKGSAFTGSALEKFYNVYGLPTIIDARAGAGFAIPEGATSVDQAYVVCTTCHTPHSMYTTTAKPGGVNKGTVPTFFFVAAPYNPGANVADGTKASSATQFCRQCHFTGAGGSNEGSGINIPTAF